MGTTNLDSLELGGDLTVAGSETITGGVIYSGNVTLGDTSADVVTINGTSQVNAPFTVGVNGTGYDVKLYGDTTGCNLLWDESADQLVLTRTSASTDAGTSVEPFYMSSTMTGIGGVGGRARFRLDTNVALGGWSNALKAQTVYGAAGRTTGLGSAFVAEMDLSAGTSSGTYAPLEIELNMPSGAVTGTATSFIYASAQGAALATLETNGFFVNFGGIAAGSGKIIDTDITTHTAYGGLRVNIPGVGVRYIALVSN